jgi:hypothetical protein
VTSQFIAPVTALVIAVTVVACGSGRPALVFEPAQMPGGTVGLPYAGTVTVTQNETPVGDIYVANGSLPPGLTLQFERGGTNSTAQITGTPTTAGSFEFTLGAWCLGTNVSGQAGEKSYTIEVE